MSFMVVYGSRFRVFDIVEDFSREVLAVEVMGALLPNYNAYQMQLAYN